MKIHDVKQGSGEWIKLRLGLPTASEFDNLVTPEWKLRTGQGVDSYLYRKLAEKVMGVPLHDMSSWAQGQGSLLENEALPWFIFDRGVDVQRVGFCTTDDGLAGCSPDGLIGEEGGIEIKCPQPEAHLRYLMDGKLPKDYAAQVHGSLYVTGRKWWWFLSYSRQFAPFLIRVERDEEIQMAIGKAIRIFNYNFQGKLEKITAMRDAENAAKNAAYEKSVAEGRA